MNFEHHCKRPISQTMVSLLHAVLILVTAKWGAPASEILQARFLSIYYKWYITGFLGLILDWSFDQDIKNKMAMGVNCSSRTTLSAFFSPFIAPKDVR